MPYIPQELKTQAFITGKTELYTELCSNPELRLVPIRKLEAVRESLKDLDKNFRIRYRGPHGRQRDTLKRNAYAFTVYIYDNSYWGR